MLVMTEVDEKVVEKVLGASGLDVDLLRKQLPFGWHGPDDIDTLKGLEGDFLWAEQAEVPRVVRWKFSPKAHGFLGEYKILEMDRTTLVEEGTFHSIPNNPMIGWAFMTLQPKPVAEAKSFVVAGMFTVADWKITTLLLNKVGNQGPIGPPITLARLYV